MSELRTYLAANKVKCNIEQNAVNRFVTHHYIREAEIERIVALLKAFHGSLVPNQTV